MFGFHFRFKVLSILAIAFGLVLSEPIMASDTLDDSIKAVQTDLTEVLNETVKTALSPLLMMSVKLAIQQMDSETVDPLLIVLGLFLLLTFLKDVLPVSILKKPLDATEELTAFLPALLGLLFVLPGLTEQLAPSVAESVQAMLNTVGPDQAYAASDSELPAASTAVSPLVELLSKAIVALAGAVVYFAVWLLSNTLTILCLLVPASLGPVVKSSRLALLGLLHTLSMNYPWLAFIFSIAVIIVAFLGCRWAFRLTVWGVIYSFDLLTLAWRRQQPGRKPMVFITGDGQKKLKIAKRTLGRLTLENGRLIFRYRYFLLFPKKIELPLPDQMVIGRRLTSPMMLQRVDNRLVPLVAFRLSCRTHEKLLAQHFGGLQVQEVGLSKWLKGAWSWMDGNVNVNHAIAG